jgi:hypothetical protein
MLINILIIPWHFGAKMVDGNIEIENPEVIEETTQLSEEKVEDVSQKSTTSNKERRGRRSIQEK